MTRHFLEWAALSAAFLVVQEGVLWPITRKNAVVAAGLRAIGATLWIVYCAAPFVIDAAAAGITTLVTAWVYYRWVATYVALARMRLVIRRGCRTGDIERFRHPMRVTGIGANSRTRLSTDLIDERPDASVAGVRLGDLRSIVRGSTVYVFVTPDDVQLWMRRRFTATRVARFTRRHIRQVVPLFRDPDGLRGNDDQDRYSCDALRIRFTDGLNLWLSRTAPG